AIQQHDSLKNYRILPFKVIEDNFDLTVIPNYITMLNQPIQHHWWLHIALEKGITAPHLPSDRLTRNILDVPNCEFIPSVAECQELEHNMAFHVAQVLTKRIPFFKQFAEQIPNHI
ncbi:unnamed protein product, partial [Owenia fusiformis]